MDGEAVEIPFLPKRQRRVISAVIGVAPLVLAAILLAYKFDDLVSPPIPEVEPIYYPAVSVVFVSTSEKRRTVPLPATIKAERRVGLAADQPGRIAAVLTRPGRKVTKGDALCRVQPVVGGDAEVLFSPLDGLVATVNGSRGTYLAGGQACLTILDPSSMVAAGAMTERQATVIAAGDPARVSAGTQAEDSAVRVVYTAPTKPPVSSFEVALGQGFAMRDGNEAQVRIRTGQLMPTLIPAKALALEPGRGMVVRLVEGQGPIGVLRTVPVTLVAAAPDGLYVEGLPEETRLVLKDEEFPVPEDGTPVRIGKVN